VVSYVLIPSGIIFRNTSMRKFARNWLLTSKAVTAAQFLSVKWLDILKTVKNRIVPNPR
jgi:hypothetical protein